MKPAHGLSSMNLRHQGWLFKSADYDSTPKQIWRWWEERRLAYNSVVVLTALISLIAFYFFCGTSGKLAPGEDAVEPMGLFLGAFIGPISWNLAYCLGPVCDIALRHFSKQRHIGPILLKLGLIFSCLVLCIPSTIWGIIWVQQLLKVLFRGSASF